MNLNLRKWAVVAAAAAMVLAAVVVAGCSSKQGQSEPAATSQAAPQSVAATEAEHGESAETVEPAGTVAEIWTQIAGEQTQLTAAIQNAQLKDVHHLAFGIRDLVVALADKAKAVSPASAAKLDGMVEQVKASATKLDELGDAGNLSGTQVEYAKLETVLGAIKAVPGAK